MTGLVDRTVGDRGTSEHWSLRGIRFRLDVHGGGNVVSWTFADPDDGCFLIPAPFSATTYVVQFRPYTHVLAEGNELYVRSSSGTLPYYDVQFTIAGAGQTFDIEYPQDLVLPRMFATYAYAIQNRFRAHYEDTRLTVWNDSAPGCSSDRFCKEIAGYGGIHINIETNNRKFVMAHEYGHANAYGAGASVGQDCGMGGSGHGMRGPEWASCAATEGWAHFVAADTFNDHAGGSAAFEYWDPSSSIFNVETGSGQCSSPAHLRWPYRFAVTCKGVTNHPAVGVELDWLRFLWDYHRNPGTAPNHDDMQEAFIDAGSWSKDDVYERARDALSSTFESRWISTAGYNRVCEPSDTC